MHSILQPVRLAALAAAAAALTACGGDSHSHDGDEGHGHAHEAQYGGVLCPLGDHFANVEVVYAADSGTLTVYGLGAHAVQAERAPEKALAVSVAPDGAEPITLSLDAIASELSGETVGDSSKFEAQSDEIKGWDHFHGTIAAVTLRGTKFEAVEFAWPPGEHDHGHEEGHDEGEGHEEGHEHADGEEH